MWYSEGKLRSRSDTLKMVENILVIVSSLNVFMEQMLKWREKRIVIGFRPPLGGPMAHKNCTSTKLILEVSLRSYLCKEC